MDERTAQSSGGSEGKASGRSGPTLFYIMLGVIVAALAIFIFLSPGSSGGGSGKSSPSSSSGK